MQHIFLNVLSSSKGNWLSVYFLGPNCNLRSLPVGEHHLAGEALHWPTLQHHRLPLTILSSNLPSLTSFVAFDLVLWHLILVAGGAAEPPTYCHPLHASSPLQPFLLAPLDLSICHRANQSAQLEAPVVLDLQLDQSCAHQELQWGSQWGLAAWVASSKAA